MVNSMNILYTCDDNYVWLMGISAISLFENNRNIKEIDVYLLGDSISNENKKMLSEIGEKYQRNIYVIDVPELKIPEELVSSRWPISAFTRLFAAELLPDNINEVLYLDCDTVVTGNLEELTNIDMGELLFYGVRDCVGKQYRRNIGLKSEDNYINAGVLLINTNKLRELDVITQLAMYIKEYKAYINYADQDILNGAFVGKIGVLKPSYDVMTITAAYSYNEIQILRKPTNYYSELEISESLKNPIIIHFTTNMLNVRPWYSNTNHPFAKIFTKYLKMSPWKDKTLKQFEFHNKESKIIKIINVLPKGIANCILGLIHSELKPLYISVKARNKVTHQVEE